MSLILDIGSTGMIAQQMNVEVISNNIANMTTTGYKRQRAEFQDLLYQNKVSAGAQSSDAGTIVPTGIQIGLGVKTGAVYRIYEQGALKPTSGDFDIAIKGNGFFQIELPTGETGYTRDGSLQLNENREIVNAQGYKVLPGISVPADAIGVEINENGEILVKIQGQTSLSNVGTLQLVRFPNENGLEAIGGNLALETAASGSPTSGNPGDTGFGFLQQGFLETSNVNAVEEITSLIRAQRAYEMNSKTIQTGDQMLSVITQMR